VARTGATRLDIRTMTSRFNFFVKFGNEVATTIGLIENGTLKRR
jgi:hypothetical protein